MSFVRFLAWFAIGGVLVPLIFQVVWWLVDRYQPANLDLGLGVQRIMLILWPSSLMMLPAGSDESLFLVALSISIVVNVVFYVAIGVAIWYGFRKHHVILVLLAIVIGVIWWRMLTL